MEAKHIALHLDEITTVTKDNRTYVKILVCLQGDNINISDWYSSEFPLEYICQTVLSKYYEVGTKCEITIYSLGVIQKNVLSIIIAK